MASTHQSLHRAIAILRVFSEQSPALTVTEISERLELHKSTVSRILSALLDEGLVWHEAVSGRYSLGMSVVEMAGVALGQIDVRAAAMPHIDAVATATGETVSVLVRRDYEAVTVALAPSPNPVRHVVWIGRRMPLDASAAGQVLLAARLNRGDAWRHLVKERSEPAWVELEQRLERIASAGYAIDIDGYERGASAVAAPIIDPLGLAVGAVALSGPTDRFAPDGEHPATVAVRAAADAIALDLGVRAPGESEARVG